MFAIYRCAACGSPRVKADEKSEGYSITKGVAGTVLLGGIGAAAGIYGNKKMYYHCPDCGTTLSYPMSREIVQLINMSIADPSKNISSLRNWKKSYPNIEWTDVETLSDEPRQISSFYGEDDLQSLSDRIPNVSSMSVERVKEIVEKKILKYHEIIGCKKATEDDIKRAIGYKKYNHETDKVFFNAYSDAINQLQEEFTLGVETINGENNYIFLTETEKKEHAIAALAKKAALEVARKEGDLICKDILKNLLEDTWIIEVEWKNIAIDRIVEITDINDPLILDTVYINCKNRLLKSNDLMTKTLEDGTIVYSRTSSESKVLEEKKKHEAFVVELKGYSDAAIKIKKQKIIEAKRLMLFMENKLTMDERVYPKYALIKIKNEDNELKSAYSDEEFEELLFWAVYTDLLEYDGYSFSLPGKRPKENLELLEIKRELDEEEAEFSIIQKKLMQHKAELQSLSAYFEEQRKILGDNLGKFFGEGARKKKEAIQNLEMTKIKIASCNTQIEELDKKILVKRNKIERMRVMFDKEEALLSPIDRISTDGSYILRRRGTVKKYSDQEISIRTEVLRVLQKENIPMCCDMMPLYSEELKRQIASIGRTRFLYTLLKMKSDGLILPIALSGVKDTFYVPLYK